MRYLSNARHVVFYLANGWVDSKVHQYRTRDGDPMNAHSQTFGTPSIPRTTPSISMRSIGFRIWCRHWSERKRPTRLSSCRFLMANYSAYQRKTTNGLPDSEAVGGSRTNRESSLECGRNSDGLLCRIRNDRCCRSHEQPSMNRSVWALRRNRRLFDLDNHG